MPSDGAIVLYDVTRLVHRHREKTPTGIDRVDLRYAKHLVDKHGERCIFVFQTGGGLARINKRASDALLKYLWASWVDGVAFTTKKFKINPPILSNDNEVPAKSGIFELDSLAKKSYLDRYAFFRKNDLRPILPKAFHWVWHLPKPIRHAIFSAAAVSIPTVKYLNDLQKRYKISTENISSKNNKYYDSELLEILQKFSKTNIIYVNTSHHGLGNEDLFLNLLMSWSVKFIFYIHDIIPIDFPEYVRPGFGVEHRERMRVIAQVEPKILVNSNNTKSRVEFLFDDLGFPKPDVRVAYIGLEERFLENKAIVSEAKPEHFVMLGTIEPRKNHLLILNVWRELVESGRKDVPKLYVIGKRGWENENVLDMLERCPAMQSHVVELSGVSDQTIVDLLQRSYALLFPSFSEGWGMPLVEALGMGIPAICSDIAVFREAGQGLPDYIHPLDGPGWRDAILDYSKPESVARTKQLQRLENFHAPEWSNHFAALDDIISNSALNQKNSAPLRVGQKMVGDVFDN